MMTWKKMARLLRIQTCLLVISMTLTILLLLFHRSLNNAGAYTVFIRSITTPAQENKEQNQQQLFFAPDSCLSRQQSSSYRSRLSLSQEPSAYLLSKLRAYEDLHRRCGPHTDGYNRTVRFVLHSSKSWTNNGNSSSSSSSSSIVTGTDCSYLVWYPFSGLGNRIISLASSFLYALLTDRVLLVNFGTDMSDLFCEPFPYSSWILPDDFPYKDMNRVRSDLPLFQSIIAARQGNNWAMPSSVPPAVHAYLEHGGGKTRFFHCDESHEVLNKVPLLVLASDVYFIPSLFMTPLFLPELNKMFPENTPSVFHHLGHYIFLPSNQAWNLITHYYDAHLSQADVKVGIQVRIFNPRSTPPEAMLDQIITCCTQNHHSNVLPKVDKEAPPFPNNNNNSSSSFPTKKKAILVASLYSHFADGLRDMYRTWPTVDGSLVSVYQPSNEGHQRFRDKGQNINAWVEMYLLSLCDELVTSAQSTFGYVAQGLAGVRSWVLMTNHNTNNDSSSSPSHFACHRAPTFDPCFHAPPKFNCATKGGIHHISHIFPFIGTCHDFPLGIRLN